MQPGALRFGHGELRMTSPSPVNVERFHQILVWPLRLKTSSSTVYPPLHLANKLVKDSSGVWGIKHGSEAWAMVRADAPTVGPDNDDRDFLRYAEAAYFHPYIRDLLYPNDTHSPMQVLSRTDVRQMRATLGDDGNTWQITLDVRRVLLFLFGSGVAVLAVEVKTVGGSGASPAQAEPDAESTGAPRAHTGSLTIQQAEELLDCLRCAYPAYWKCDTTTGKPGRAGHSPRLVEWLDSKNNVISKSNYDDHQSFIDPVVEPESSRRTVRCAKHWSDLFECTPDGHTQPSLRFDQWFDQVEDERIPTMGYLAVDDPRSLTPGDFARLTFLDEPGDSGTMPYSPTFLDGFEAKYAYDRFWLSGGAPAGVNQAAAWTAMTGWMTTRFLVSGYGFIVVGNSRDKEFFTNENDGMLAHFRHHYFKLFMLAHMQKASLLAFSARLTDAVDQITREPGVKIAKSYNILLPVRQDFIHFTCRYLHTEVSNQVQAKELYAILKENLGIVPIYDELQSEIDSLDDMLKSKAQGMHTSAMAQLTMVLGLVSILAMIQALITLPGCQQLPLPSYLPVALAAIGFIIWFVLYGVRFLK